mmetsp:Transcript_12991/g.19187  ORF Transcript_12991/g.19187 Transcript_12991/m.19187 type:complete len:233 (-) Transcript_12991:244-942(-)
METRTKNNITHCNLITLNEITTRTRDPFVQCKELAHKVVVKNLILLLVIVQNTFHERILQRVQKVINWPSRHHQIRKYVSLAQLLDTLFRLLPKLIPHDQTRCIVRIKILGVDNLVRNSKEEHSTLKRLPVRVCTQRFIALLPWKPKLKGRYGKVLELLQKVHHTLRFLPERVISFLCKFPKWNLTSVWNSTQGISNRKLKTRLCFWFIFGHLHIRFVENISAFLKIHHHCI